MTYTANHVYINPHIENHRDREWEEASRDHLNQHPAKQDIHTQMRKG